MPKITYVQPDGTASTLDVPVGLSVMRGAIENGVDGILAECGGACACATCQVVVDPSWSARLAPPEMMERSMLDADDGGENRRLSCQIAVTEALDGLIVHVPDAQY